ncbi:hypothetical protein J7E25_11855 [Agromyces sp. ISL-38]|uniref:hypothetical protein n=1 Tax=Agromyces sp. ISL-38 TaxID=2819107 RepID=UPI001BED09F7|nr:hypothetical protein [Agromyces sp. ISL-38]MBT2499789.1 hypothetical protein [Agromyces sp. ISL-38]
MSESDALPLPEHWSAGARDAFSTVIDQRPDLSGADFAALEQAAELIASADALDAAARERGVTSTGSQGQLVVSPLVVEARLARSAAATILARLVAPTAGAKTNTQRAREAAKIRWSAR